MNRLLRCALLTMLVSMACLVATADTLYLRAGEQEAGLLKQLTPETVVFKGPDGEKTLPKADVTSIQLQQPRQFDDIEKADQITDRDLKACVEKQPGEKDYPADGSVTLLQRKTFDLTTPGVVKETNRAIIKILRQRGEEAGSVTVWHFEDTDTAEVDFALTITPDGRVLHLSDAALKTESIFTNLPAYKRVSRLRYACKEPRAGSILDVQYTIVRKRDPVLESFYAEEVFGDDSPVLRKEVKVLLPPGAKDAVNVDVKPADRDLIQVVSQDNPPAILLTLAKPQPGLVPEPLMPPIRNILPTVTLAVPATWKDISKTYAAELAKVAPLSDALKSKAAELAKKGGARAIYNYIVRDIRTAPVPQLQYRMTPHAPDETVQRGLANELDKNVLYFKMLEAAGIPCTFALIRDRASGHLDETVPALRAFNRSAVYLAKEKRFSNAASDILPYESLAGDLQGPGGDLENAPALLIKPEGADLTHTQAASLKDDLQAKRFNAKLGEDGSLDLSVTFSGKGAGGAGFRAMKDLDEQKVRNQMQQLAASIHPAAVMKDYKTSDLADLDANPEISLQCAIPGYAVKAGDDLMLFNLPLIDYDAGDVGRPTRTLPLCWPRVSRSVCEGSVALPKGFKIYALPKGVKCNAACAHYRAKLNGKHDAIQFRDESDIKLQDASSEAYADYKKFKELRANFSRQRIILTRE